MGEKGGGEKTGAQALTHHVWLADNLGLQIKGYPGFLSSTFAIHSAHWTAKVLLTNTSYHGDMFIQQ